MRDDRQESQIVPCAREREIHARTRAHRVIPNEPEDHSNSDRARRRHE